MLLAVAKQQLLQAVAMLVAFAYGMRSVLIMFLGFMRSLCVKFSYDVSP